MDERYFNSKSKRAILFALVMVLITSVFVSTPFSVNAESETSVSTSKELKKGKDLSGSKVYFGTADGSIEWTVVDEDHSKGTVTLFSTSAGINTTAYNKSSKVPDGWSGSDLCKWINSDEVDQSVRDWYPGSGFLAEKFTTVESESIATYGTTEEAIPGYNYEEIKINQKIVIPSFEEIYGTYGGERPWGSGANASYDGTWELSKNVVTSITGDEVPTFFFLRTPAEKYSAMIASGNIPATLGVGDSARVLPALKLDLSSVFLTSAAEGGKSASVGSFLSTAKQPEGEMKLTLYDGNLKLDNVTPTAVTSEGTISFDYGGASSSFTLSAVVMDDNNSVKHYGKLLENTNASGSKVEVEVPDDYDTANDTLKIFVEELNGDKNSDYASTAVDINISSQSSAPAGITASACTTSANNDGIIGGVTSEMEYMVSGGSQWTGITGTELTGLKAGTYEVRYKNKVEGGTVYINGTAQTVTINEYTPLAITNTNTTLSVEAGRSESLTVTATGDPAPTFSARLKGNNALPNWITIDEVTGVITASPSNDEPAKDTSITVTASNGTAPDAAKDFTISVKKSEVFHKQYQIRYENLFDATNAAENPSIYTVEDADIMLQAPTRIGYEFAGWYSDKDLTIPASKIVKGSTGDKTFYAKWKAATLKVAFHVNGGKSIATKFKAVTFGAEYGELPAPKKTGYTFRGWYTRKSGGTRITADTTVQRTEDQTLYAQWTEGKYKVTFIGNSGKVRNTDKKYKSSTTRSMTYGQRMGSLPKARRTGYKFMGWYTSRKGGRKVTGNTKMTYTRTKKLYARWTPNARIVNCEWVHLRKGPGILKGIKGYVRKGTKISVMKAVKGSGLWYKVRVGRKTGYIYSKYIRKI